METPPSDTTIRLEPQLPSRRGNQLNGNWSAWLGEYEDKIVIAPQFESFTGVCGWGFEGLIPNNWIVL